MTIQHALGACRSNRRNWRHHPKAVAVAAWIFGATLAGHAAAASDASAQTGPICRSVMGLQPGEAQYADCVESLSDSLARLDDGRTIASARATCLESGQAPDTPGLAECILRLGDQPAASAPRTLVVDSAPPSDTTKSYFRTAPREIHRREQRSCARLGFDPTSPGFGGCVADLQSALFAADNPMN